MTTVGQYREVSGMKREKKRHPDGMKIALIMPDKNTGGLNMAGINFIMAIAEGNRCMQHGR